MEPELEDCGQPWEAPDQGFPTCLWDHLREIQFKGFAGKYYQLEVIQYLLGNASMLERMEIHTSSAEAVMHSEAIRNYPRASMECAVTVDGL